MENRVSGILCHITSLPSPFGIGDLGPNAYAFADFLAETRQSYWQVLPLNPTSTAKHFSPYNSLSAFAGNVLLISPELLVEEGLLRKEDLQKHHPKSEEKVCYDEVFKFKQDILSKAYQGFRKPAAPHHDYDRFCLEHAFWLDDYAMFSALLQRHEGKSISKWPRAVKNREHHELKNLQEELQESMKREKFLQYIFFRQWFALKNYCNNKGIQMIGDFAFFMDYDSADAWAHSEFFKLDSEKKPTAMAGSPPDHFAPKGQLFDCAVYDWDELKKSGFSWWIARFKHMFNVYDVIRIDHFRGLIAHWEVPVEEKTGENGKWQPAPFFDFMNSLLKHVPAFPVIAEDLGMITPDVREAMRTYNIPGIKMLLYAFAHEMREEAFLPHSHISNCVVYTGTHDSITCQGWFQRKEHPDDKKRFFSYIGSEVKDEVNWVYIRMALMSVAKTAIIQLQDLLGLGEDARMNTPGKPDGNWLWRFQAEQLSKPIKKRLAEMTKIYGRS